MLSVFYISWVDISMYNEKVLGDSKMLKEGGVTYLRKLEKN
jgi:hypothetical protein